MEQPPLTIGIIVIGYNRPDSIGRLLDRLNACDYPHDRTPPSSSSFSPGRSSGTARWSS